MYTYAWYHWLTFFYIYCFLGWVFESTYVSIKEHHPVNRGFLRLPMLPLYGTGAVMMLWVSLPLQKSVILVYIAGVIAATTLEYVTGYCMEKLFKVRYWDYSKKKFNVNGYICLGSSIAWGFLTIIMVYVIHDPLSRVIVAMPHNLEWTLLAIVSCMFVYDSIHSVREALQFSKALAAIAKVRAELDSMQTELSHIKSEAGQHAAALRESIANRRERLSAYMKIQRPSILRRNPGAVSKHFESALGDLRNAWNERKKV